jgi:hypothetical protein
MFFSEEKNQKTFVPAPAGARGAGYRLDVASKSKNLLALFFRKERAFLCHRLAICYSW